MNGPACGRPSSNVGCVFRAGAERFLAGRSVGALLLLLLHHGSLAAAAAVAAGGAEKLGDGPIVSTEHGLRGFGSPEDVAVLIDAGSQGSKVFSFGRRTARLQLKTRCSQAKFDEGKTNQGIAALGYSKEECQWQVGAADDSEDLKPLEKIVPDYAEALLALLNRSCSTAAGREQPCKATNRERVPMLATAGMRLVPQETNRRIWGYLCGQAAAGFTLATQESGLCGTIPGTSEAYYEYLANAARGRSRVLTGTFTIGGASAQISIPLKSQQDVDAFLKMKASVAAELDCTAMLLPNGEPVPIFNKIRHGGPRRECIDDYITFVPVAEINATHKVLQQNIRISEIQGVGLVSFLGLRGSGTLVAGGVVEIQNWAQLEGCGVLGHYNFSTCIKKLRTALSKDILWKHVTAYFQDHAMDIHNFSYNTYAAVPEDAGLPHVDGKDQAWELEEQLAKRCARQPNATFGYRHENTCMRAYYTSLYITAFFERTNASGIHGEEELTFDHSRAWTEGLVEELKADGDGGSVFIFRELRHHTTHFLEGVALSHHSRTGDLSAAS